MVEGAGAGAVKGGISQHTDKLGPGPFTDGKAAPGQGLSDFELVAELGRGTYGVVTKVRSKLDGKIYCMKRVKCGHMSPQRQREVLMEVLMLRRLNHKNVIGYYTSFVEKKSLYIVMEYASNGDLQRVLDEHKRNKSYVPEKVAHPVLHVSMYTFPYALEIYLSQYALKKSVRVGARYTLTSV